jgi:hypothetical protein
VRRLLLAVTFASAGVGAASSGNLGSNALGQFLLGGGGAVAGALALLWLIRYSFQIMLGLREPPLLGRRGR